MSTLATPEMASPRQLHLPGDVSAVFPETDFEHVLVPLDGSAASLAALPTAYALADQFGATVHPVTVARVGSESAALRKIGQLSGRAYPATEPVLVLAGTDPATAIANYAKQLGTCVIAMSTRGRGRLGGAVLGSTARSVLSQVGPIVMVGPNADRPGWSTPPPGWRASMTTRRIVACVDGSRDSETILPVAASWAHALGMSLSILMFIDDAPSPLGPDSRTNDPHEYVQRLAGRWVCVVPAIDAFVVKEPIGPATGLRLHLDRHPAGLVAVSTQARSGLRRLLGGATADRMVRASVAPCLVVPPVVSTPLGSGH